MEFRLTEEQQRLRAVARDFARTRIREAARRLDGAADPADTYPRELIEEASELGLRTMSLPPTYGGLGTDELTETIVLEELCYGDVGFGMTIAHPWREGRMIARYGTDEQRERFLPAIAEDPACVTALGITEAHSGSDNGLPYTGSLEAGPRTSAVRDGSEWVLDGRKRWITSGNVAKLLIVAARTDSGVPWTEGISLFIVTSDTPGFRPGELEDKLGIRLNQNAELVFEDCRVPGDQLLGTVNKGSEILRHIGPSSKAKEAAKSLGVGQAALDVAREYADTRVQGGTEIRNHGTVSGSLAEMATELEAARTLVWRAAWASDHDEDAAHVLSDMAKLFTSRVVVRVAVRALELHGGAGIRRGTDVERYLRNAVSMLHAPIGNDAVLQRIDTALANA